jgi:Na+/H+-dicarboxylate symporter
MKGASTIAADLSVLERVLLFCLASNTEWGQAGVTGATTIMMLARGLVDREPPAGSC